MSADTWDCELVETLATCRYLQKYMRVTTDMHAGCDGVYKATPVDPYTAGS